ncbi:sulfotransferase 1C4 [Lingula anatina]|uniref:Sulfotransferase 1C4 n=1 Tax=Lingula anatina TaxID=7574 RepID=A0A1S3JXQ0_LINAN|nr:sulfotransferase 1C4 [Lingula anatina]|eukprot:XP_013414831.1 sulfotransferase 1C4 [Lingula anatina]
MAEGEHINGIWLVRYRNHILPTMEVWPEGYGWKKWFDEAETKFKARPDDLYIASFPKSGHHWSFEFVNMLYQGNAHSVNKSKLNNFFELRTIKEIEDMPSPRILLTHLPYDLMPRDIFEKNCKIIYIMRNPKDVCVSQFHHVSGIAEYKYDGDWDHFFKVFLKGEVDYGPWFKHVKDWWKLRQEYDHMMYVHYEELKKCLPAQIKRIAEFINKTHDEQMYLNIANACTFEAMKKNAQFKELPGIFKTKEGSFFRKGQVGDWKNTFTVAQNEEFDKAFKREMEDCDIQFTFD